MRRSGAATVAEFLAPRHSGFRPSTCDRKHGVGSKSVSAGRQSALRVERHSPGRPKSALAAIAAGADLRLGVGRGLQPTVGPLEGLGVVQRIVLAARADVAIPARGVGHELHRPPARGARLPDRMKHRHVGFPAGASLVRPAVRAQAHRGKLSGTHRPPSGLTTPRQRIEIQRRDVAGWRHGSVLQGFRAAGARSSREGGSIHAEAAAGPGQALRRQVQTCLAFRQRSAPAPATHHPAGVYLFRTGRGLTLQRRKVTSRPWRTVSPRLFRMSSSVSCISSLRLFSLVLRCRNRVPRPQHAASDLQVAEFVVGVDRPPLHVERKRVAQPQPSISTT